MQNVLFRSQAAVIRPAGSLVAANVLKFQTQLHSAVLSDQHSSVLIDLEQVEAIDSAGLMALISALNLARRCNKRFGLCSVPHPIRMVLELAQLDRVFNIQDYGLLEEAA